MREVSEMLEQEEDHFTRGFQVVLDEVFGKYTPLLLEQQMQFLTKVVEIRRQWAELCQRHAAKIDQLIDQLEEL
jgi:hypothetical protein